MPKTRYDHALALQMLRVMKQLTAHMQCRGPCWVSLSDVNQRMRLSPTDLDYVVRWAASAEWIKIDGPNPHSMSITAGGWDAMREEAA